MINDEQAFGIQNQVLIAFSKKDRDGAEKQFPGKFVFAKYLSIRDVLAYRMNTILRDIQQMGQEGYSLAKIWAAPRSRDFSPDPSNPFSLRDPRLKPLFETLAEYEYPLLLHVSDPDTFYQTAYANKEKYGTKEEHLDDLEYLLEQYPHLSFQLAHFGSQPEISRLPRLARWFDTYPNFVIDTASSRWMARELSKNPRQAKTFLTKYSKRILFGTDVNVSPRPPNQNPITDSFWQHHTQFKDYLHSPFAVRCLAQRILWETKQQNIPLPFPDADTIDSGGTFINGLNLSVSVLRDLYWNNAQRLYGSMLKQS
jgi:predicted TIM-barrel fold metal-dependent hydrolase